jgi:4-amino-4-deoxy-L-arabinose transferase-like glycosyltransferase
VVVPDGLPGPGSRFGFALRRPVLTAVLVAALLYLPWLAAAPVRGTLEANRLVASREMLRRGDWVLPTLNGAPYLAKPPFQYWIIEAIAGSTGLDVLVAGRLVSALAVIALAAMVAAFGRRTVSPLAGLAAGIAVPLAGIVVEKGALAELETVLAATTAAAGLAYHLAVVDAKKRLLWILLGGLAFGAAFLTKGPIVLLFLVPAAIALAAASPPAHASPGARARATGVLLAQIGIGAAAALPWVIALLSRTGWDKAFSNAESEIFSRVGHAGASNVAKWWFYARGLPSALGPLLLLAPFLFVLPWRSERRPRLLFLLAWAVVPILILSFFQGKETRYLISGIPAWALLLAEGLSTAVADDRLPGYRRVLRVFVLALSWLAPAAAIVGAFLTLPSLRNAALVGGALLLAARLLLSIPRATIALGASSALLGLLGVKVVWARVYLAGARVRRPELEMERRIAEKVPAGSELLVPRYDSVLHLGIDRPLRVVPDLRSFEAAAGATALVLPDSVPASGWVEIDRFDVEAGAFRLIRREP